MITMAYEVTIGIPVYNVEKYIRLTMDSALAQTFDSIEFLVLDDCGTDSSMDIVREYQRTHPRGKDIRILRQPQKMGIGAGRNRMMAEATGRYFYSLDGDDSISPNAIELLYSAAVKHEAELVYGSFERIYVEEEKTVHSEQFPYPSLVFTLPDEYAEYAYSHEIQVMNWNYLIRMDVIRRNNLRVTPVGHGYGEDFTYTVDLPTYVTRVVLLPEITYQYYMRKKDFKAKRSHPISRVNMDMAIESIAQKKARKDELRNKSYYAKRNSVLLMYDYSFACRILAKGNDIDIPYTKAEIRNIMWHPMTLCEILHSRQARIKNLGYWLMGVLPPALSVFMIRMTAKLFHRI